MPRPPKAKIMSLPDEDDASKIRRLGKALTAVGEAYFFFAEEKRDDVEKIKFPDYKGAGSKEAVLKHIKGPVMDWIKKKRPAIEKAQDEYLKIVELQPTPPPRWVIAAGSQVGGLWGKFVKEFRAAPIPADIKKDIELRNAYYGGLDEASEPDKLKAKAAFETCLKYSVTYQFFDEYSRKCEVWLSKTYKNEYHAVDEFRASPNNIGSGLNDRPYPLADRWRSLQRSARTSAAAGHREVQGRQRRGRQAREAQEGRRRKAAPRVKPGKPWAGCPGARSAKRRTERDMRSKAMKRIGYCVACSVLFALRWLRWRRQRHCRRLPGDAKGEARRSQAGSPKAPRTLTTTRSRRWSRTTRPTTGPTRPARRSREPSSMRPRRRSRR